MAFRRSDLQEAFFVPGTHAFRVYGYGTTDPLEDVLAPDYFATARGLLRAGELIYVSIFPQATPGRRAEPGAARVALVMVRADERDPGRPPGSARLVQDFGRPSDAPPTFGLPSPAAAGIVTPEPPVKRGRGRPPGSRTKKPAAAMQAQWNASPAPGFSLKTAPLVRRTTKVGQRKAGIDRPARDHQTQIFGFSEFLLALPNFRTTGEVTPCVVLVTL